MLLIATINIRAQQIKGRVVEIVGEEEIPLPGANVVWEGTNTGTTSNSEGFYLIDEPESYPATLVVTFVGYQTYKRVIKKWSHYHIVMKSFVGIDEIKVKGKVNTTKISTLDPINIQIITTGELEKAACCNLSESLVPMQLLMLLLQMLFQDQNKYKCLVWMGFILKLHKKTYHLLEVCLLLTEFLMFQELGLNPYK